MDYITRIRRELHRCPEVGFDLTDTLAIVRRELEEMGVEYTEKYGKSSIVATVNPEKTHFTVAIRADMDALPITERTGAEYSSRNEGRMHACGHDAHTAIALGALKRINEMRDGIGCRVVFIFQAAEEYATSGARLMAEDGVMDGIDCIAALHCDPHIDVGNIAIIDGYRNAASDGFLLNFYGKSAHAAYKSDGIDAIAMAARAHVALSEYTDAEIAAGEPMIFNIGKISGGETNNIVCDKCSMFCTLRTWNDGAAERVMERIRDICTSCSRAIGGEFEFVSVKHYPMVYNDPRVTAVIRECGAKVVGADRVLLQERRMGGEDFSYFANIKPGAMFHLGTGNAERGIVSGLHNDRFDIDEAALSVGADIFVDFVLRMAQRGSV